MSKCLITTYGYFGDIIFSTSIAKKLKDENKYDVIDFLIGFPQVKELVSNNPYIDNVFISDNSTYDAAISLYRYTNKYDNIIKLDKLSFTIPPPQEYQLQAGVQQPDSNYKVYTSEVYDEIAKTYISELKMNNNKPVLAILSNWKERSFLFTEDEYNIGIDVPNLGYGGKRRDVDYIISKLSSLYNIYYVGMPDNTSHISTTSIEHNDVKSLLFEASIIKYCDYFIGAEGGICNIAAGVGTKTIITGDFIHQLYGYNGSVRKLKEPKLGPKFYFRDDNHKELSPYLTDDEVIINIINIVGK